MSLGLAHQEVLRCGRRVQAPGLTHEDEHVGLDTLSGDVRTYQHGYGDVVLAGLGCCGCITGALVQKGNGLKLCLDVDCWVDGLCCCDRSLGVADVPEPDVAFSSTCHVLDTTSNEQI